MGDEIRPLFPRGDEVEGDTTRLVIGAIYPAPDDAPAPIVIRPNDRQAITQSACDHGNYQLHERWQTVTCGSCGRELAPFAVLQRYGEWYQQIVRERQRLYNIHAGALIEQMRAMLPKVALSAADREQLRDLINNAQARTWKDAPAWIREAAALLDALQRKIWYAQHTRRAKRNGQS